MTDDAAQARDWADDAAEQIMGGELLTGERRRSIVATALRKERLAAEARGRAAVDSVLHDFIRAYDEGVFGDAGWHDREADIVARIRALKDTPR
jgi:hypothetical protein